MIVVASYPKSGLHLARTLLRESGHETTHTHAGPSSRDSRARTPDIHVCRDIRDVVVSAVCHFVLERPELDPEEIRPHVLDMSRQLAGPWKHAPGAINWSSYVIGMAARSRLTVTYRDLVERPVEALSPVSEISEEAVSMARTGPTWAASVFRRGRPGGWQDVLTPSQAEEIVYTHMEGMLIVDSLQKGIRL